MNLKGTCFFSPTLLTALLLSFCICLQGACQNDTAVFKLKQLSERVVQAQAAPIPEATINEIANNFSLILPGISFEPAYKTSRSASEVLPNEINNIKDTTKIAITILKSNSLKDGIEKNIKNPLLVTFDRFLTKLNQSIDPNWEFIPVSANVIPPSGTPNAAAGMNPEAIADPNLRKQYLELIEKNRNHNLKNGQQRALRDSKNRVLKTIADLVLINGEAWKEIEVISHFCKDNDSKVVFEKYLNQRK